MIRYAGHDSMHRCIPKDDREHLQACRIAVRGAARHSVKKAGDKRLDQLTNIGFIKQLLSSFGFSFSKQMGQNFLINPSVCPKMAELSGCDGIGVLEIGPGIGVLTVQLAQRAKKVVALELDRRLQPILNVTLKETDNVSVIFGDVLKTDLAALLQEQFGDLPVVVCANLPYYITSPVLMALLEQQLSIRRITVMVQKEAAQRICAQPGTRQCGAITVTVHCYSTPKLQFYVERGSFLPAPNVDSAVITLDCKHPPENAGCDQALFGRIVRAAFAQRRKQLANALSAGLHIDKQQAAALIKQCGLPPAVRAEELTLADFKQLCHCMEETD